MRIPTSVIVMSLLTAAPFGLAIRDTLKHESGASEYDGLDLDTSSRARRERMKEMEREYEREAAREAEERSQRHAERIAKLDMLYGSTPASMGSLLEGIALGADSASFQPEAARSRIEKATRDGFMNVAFDVDAKSLNTVTVELDAYERDSDSGATTCEMLRDKLAAAWGRTTGSTWVDPATHQRASLDTTACSLVFSRYLETPAWVAALPFDAIGKPAARFVDSLGPSADSDDDGARWRIPGLGLGQGETKLEAFFDKGKVVAFKVTADSDFDTVIAIREELSSKLKVQPKRDEDTRMWSWKRKPAVVLDAGADPFTLLVGTIPWE